MLLGRDQERLALDRLLAEAVSGRSGVIALVGEPGIGKTALLDYAAERAHGMTVLRARGVESEAEVPFAGLAELLRPALASLDAIPEPQAAALSGALALGPATSAQDRFAVGAATLSLLSAYAEERPLALLVDDAHRLDGSTAEALVFASRRLLADRIALVLAVREGEPSLLDGADLRVIHVTGLDRPSAGRLLGESVGDEAADRAHRATGGNPLALLELVPDAHRLAGVPGDGPVPVSTRIAAAFGRRSEALPPPARRALLLAAASDSGDLALLARAAGSLSLDLDVLAGAEEAGLVTLAEGRLEFTHPLARSAIYAAAPAQDRREAHAALANALPDRDVDRRAWHLAAASVGPSAQASTALEHAGERALGRTAYSVAADAFERGARLAVTEERRAQLLFAGASAGWLAGSADRALPLLDEASEHATEPALLARIDQLAGHVAMRRGPIMDGYARAVAGAERVAEHEPELAVVMLAEAVHGAFYAGDNEAMLTAAERAVELADGQGSRAAFFASMALGVALVSDGHGEEGAASIRSAIAVLEASDELREDPRLLVWAPFGPMFLREADAGRGLIDRAFEHARRTAAVGALATLLPFLARDQATTDRWQAAEVSFDEAIRLTRETGQRSELGIALGGLAQLEARQGREERCRAHAAEALEVCAELGMVLHSAGWARQALGELELGLGRPDAALPHHEAQAEALRERAIADVDLMPGPELLECYLRVGRPADAAAVANDYVALARAKGQPWALARAARCRGMLAEGAEAETAFVEAIALHERTPDGYETARTRLAYGARLRRDRQRSRAREQLRAALESFEQLGAHPWADQATAELAATGETARRRDASTLDQLTPQELQIARLLAGGKTTREAAAAVFLSPKTVEYHLGHVYRKLGIHSREELAAAFGAADGQPSGPSTTAS